MASLHLFRPAVRSLMLTAVLAAPAAMFVAAPARAEVFVSVGFGPPALPVYSQPICPGDGYLWTPGYWAYGPDGYYWVPGTWVRPPLVGYLWTPGYWGWGGSAFIFHAGYWGPHVGFYGGINYGFGYGGLGYEGGYWRNGGFFYNRSVNNINVNVRNVYEHPVVVRNATYNHVSFNGGNGGVPYRASAPEEAALRERHIQPTGEQMQHQNFAAQNRQQFASVNHGHPGISAAPTPSAFRTNPGNPAAARGGFGGNRPGEANHGGAVAGQVRPRGNREPNSANRQMPSENHAAAAAPREQPRTQAPPREQPRAQAPPRQPAAAPRAESHAAPAAHSGGGHEGNH